MKYPINNSYVEYMLKGKEFRFIRLNKKYIFRKLISQVLVSFNMAIRKFKCDHICGLNYMLYDSAILGNWAYSTE